MGRHRASRLTSRLCYTAFVLGTACLWSSGRVLVAAPTGAVAPEPAAQTATLASCHTLLTDAEVATVMGRPSPGAMTQSPSGSSQCRWDWPDVDATAAASFASDDAIRAGAAATKCCPNATASAVAQFFDYTVRSEQDLGSDLPVPLDGLGQRAVLFFDDVYLKVVVQRTDGVMQVTGGHITREQLLALARAMLR